MICAEANALLGTFAAQARMLTGHALPPGVSTASTTTIRVHGHLTPDAFSNIDELGGLQLGGTPKPRADFFSFGPMPPEAAARVAGYLESEHIDYDVETTSMRRHEPDPGTRRRAAPRRPPQPGKDRQPRR